MYFAWAMDALKRGKLGGPEKPAWKKILYIYAPFAIIFVMVLSGGNSSAIIIGGMMFIIIAIGGGDFKDLAILIGAGVLILGLSYGAYKLSDGKIMGRIGTGVSRLFEKTDWEEIANTSRPGSAEWYDAIDEIRQPYSAKIAIREGGFFGKGPAEHPALCSIEYAGRLYVFFIIEEYGH